MSKREARDNIDMPDLLHPIDMMKLGTDDDPCFGTFDARANECKICGDSSVCQIYQSQLSHSNRDKVEKKQKFKDIEMEVKTQYLDGKDVKKVLVKAAKIKMITKGKALILVRDKLDPVGRIETEHIQKVIIDTVRNTNNLKFVKKKTKRYIVWEKKNK